jgi:hypothetical protein
MKLLGNLAPATLKKYKQGALGPVDLASTNLGEIASESIAEVLSDPLTTLLQQSGYGLRYNPQWEEPTLNAVKGSLPFHCDNGLGLIAFWLLHKQPLKKMPETVTAQFCVEDPWLLTARQSQGVRIGDVVIFDANKPHAWMCNGGVYAISQTIYRIRKRKP